MMYLYGICNNIGPNGYRWRSRHQRPSGMHKSIYDYNYLCVCNKAMGQSLQKGALKIKMVFFRELLDHRGLLVCLAHMVLQGLKEALDSLVSKVIL